MKAVKKVPVASWVGAAIRLLNVRAPFFPMVLTEAVVDRGVETFNLWVGSVTASELIPLFPEVDDITRDAGDKVTAATSGDGAAGSPLQDPLEESGAGRGRRRRGGALEVRLN